MIRPLMTPVREALSRRSLWGYLPRRHPAPPDGPPMLALSFDLDYRADTDALPALVECLARRDLRATLFSIGALVRQRPEPYRHAAGAGHEIANHTWSHPDNPVLNPHREFWHLDHRELVDEIGRAQDSLEADTGVRPATFRTPHFKDTPRMLAALRRFPEITAVSTALSSKCPVPTPYVPSTETLAGEQSLHYPEVDPVRIAERGSETADGALLMVPLTVCPGLRWSPFCSYSGIREPANPPTGAGVLGIPEWERRWQRMLEIERSRGFVSVYFDPLDVMRDRTTATVFDRMLDRAVDTGWQVTTVGEVARRWRATLRAGTETRHAS